MPAIKSVFDLIYSEFCLLVCNNNCTKNNYHQLLNDLREGRNSLNTVADY